MFSRNLRVINREEQAHSEAAKQSTPADSALAAPAAAPTKAQRAKEYASRVPKPRVHARSDAPTTEAPAEAAEEDGEMDALAILERQHSENQRRAAQIRAELGLA